MSSATGAPAVITPTIDPDGDPLGMLESQASSLDSTTRTAVDGCLTTIVECMQRAMSIWQSYAQSPTESDVAYTAVMRIGPERAREIHRIHLELREHARTLTAQSKVSFRDTIGISRQIDIVGAYDELGPDESGADRAAKAIQTIQERIDRIEGIAKQFG